MPYLICFCGGESKWPKEASGRVTCQPLFYESFLKLQDIAVSHVTPEVFCEFEYGRIFVPCFA